MMMNHFFLGIIHILEPAHAWGLLIHIGPWKTGTKTVQAGLASMGSTLSAHKIVGPGSTKRKWAHHAFAHAMIRACTGTGTGELHAACWTTNCLPAEETAIRAALHEPSQNVILSSEQFANVKVCPRFVEAFRAFDFIRVVVLYRNDASWVLSKYGQRLVVGQDLAVQRQPFAFPNQTMQMSVEADCLNPDTSYFERLVGSWSAAFGPSSLRVLDLDGMAAGRENIASAVVRAGFPQASLAQLQPQHNTGAVHNDAFTPLRQLLIEVLQAEPICNFSSRLNLSRDTLHDMSMQHFRSAVPGAFFKNPLPKSIPVNCSHRLSHQCGSAAKKRAHAFYKGLDAMRVQWKFYNASATQSAVDRTALPCELDREALRGEGSAVWRPWMCSELWHMSVRPLKGGRGRHDANHTRPVGAA